MWSYLVRRALLIPVTLFFIVLINFVIINLAPGDPSTQVEISNQGASKKAGGSLAFGTDDRYLQFREFFGLTLPILFNTWSYADKQSIVNILESINDYLKPGANKGLTSKQFHDTRIKMGDMSRFVMPKLLLIMEDPQYEKSMRLIAAQFFIRGGTKMAILGPNLTPEEKSFNQKLTEDYNFFQKELPLATDTDPQIDEKIGKLRQWYEMNKDFYHFEPSEPEKIKLLFFDTRFFRYMSRVATLNFGSVRNDPNKSVVGEVVKRFKYSLTLAITPMVITFFAALLLGIAMAIWQNTLLDHILNLFALVLYAIPVFVVAPFLIENVALDGHFPFTNTPIPLSGFTSPDAVYDNLTSLGRLQDTVQHLVLPLIAILYGGIAAQSRLARTAVLEVMRQDYIRTAKAKGVPPWTIIWKHIGRNASITIVTSIAGSLGIILGGSLIVETLFEIDGFGKFFYDAILNRDYNTIMFSTLAGSFLTLLGYLAADISYTLLDPRVTLD
ncbi:ABC transporter permease [Estrella lausannensis]|uniref:Putative ABC-type oligopeptide transporter, permease subunit n=1 Tax=Estrella lausannensis TaxID=483423 RepID=A0A0H5E6I3_9BACT|nr:ABC transporter permease [Estrella lausannensis]CRX38895.1 Putative ABC-type oligopeptide transporter, permease subunit [Estrella lausannensis]